jgi:cytochrome d ubiquinol oxidase subunit II
MEFLDFEALRVIWWALLGVLLIGFGILGGIDLGAAALLTYVGKSDSERRVVINSLGPTWEGNQVWFILGGGAIFAAWPTVYAVVFSNFYYALLLVLGSLILRPVGFDFRSKLSSQIWRSFWDRTLCICAILPSLVFGIAIGNVMLGVAFEVDQFMYIQDFGSFASLFSTFSLLCGFLSLSMILTQGGVFLVLKTECEIRARSERILKFTPPISVFLFALGWIYMSDIEGFKIIGELRHDGASNPLSKTVVMSKGQWLENYKTFKLLILVPLLGLFSQSLTWIFCWLKMYSYALISHSLAIFFVISTIGVSMFPFILPSTINPDMSLTVWDSSSSYLSLLTMLFAALIFVPIVLCYTSWA